MSFRYHLSTIGWMVLVVFVSLAPMGVGGSDKLPLNIPLDKLVHFVLYLVLTNLLIVGFKKQFTCRRVRYSAVVVSLILSVAFGMAMEVMQELVTDYRQFDILDILANITGAFGGIGLFRLLYGKEFFSWR